MIVGEAPGEREKEQGYPFVGPSGGILWTALKNVGISRADCFVTNTCMSTRIQTRNPSAADISAEWERLDDELRAFQGTVLFLVGGIAFHRVTGITRGITAMANYILSPADCAREVKRRINVTTTYKTNRRCPACKGSGCSRCTEGYLYHKGDERHTTKWAVMPRVLPPNVKWIVASLHPADIMRSGFTVLPSLAAACNKVAQVVNPDFQPLGNPPLLPSLDAPTIAIDIETEGEAVAEVGIATRHGAANWLWGSVARDLIYQLFNQTEKTLVFHNCAFDIPRLEELVGPCLAPTRDTMLEAQHLCPDLPKGLEKVAALHLPIRPWKHTHALDPRGYNLRDAWYTALLADILAAEIAEKSQGETIARMQRAMPVLWKITRDGLRVNMPFRAKWLPELEEKLRSVRERWNYPHISLSNNYQLSKLVYDYFKLPRQFTEKGNLSVEASAISILLEAHATKEEHISALSLIKEYRENLTNYNGWAKIHVDHRGYIHPEFVPQDKEPERGRYWASTGRIQARNPNISNPDRDARRLILPRPGEMLAYIDWSKAEARVEAACSGDDVLMEAIESGLHQDISRRLGCDAILAKNLWYGNGRFAGNKKLVKVFRSKGIILTTNQIQALKDELHRSYPKWAKWRDRLVAEAEVKGYGENPFGRRRYFYGQKQAPEVVGNFPQSTIADMLYLIIPEVAEWLYIPMHDAGVFSVSSQSQVDFIQSVMEREFPQVAPGFKIPTSVKLGLPDESWGDMEDRYDRA